MNQADFAFRSKRHPLETKLTGTGILDAPDQLTIAAIWLLLLSGVFQEFLGQSELFSIGSYSFHSTDPAIIISLLAVISKLSRGVWPRSIAYWPVLVISALFLINTMRGFFEESHSAFLWFRTNGAIFTMLLLSITVTPSSAIISSTRQALLFSSIILSALTLLRLATFPTLFMISGVSDAEANDGGRALSSAGTYIMVITSALITSEVLGRSRLIFDRLTAFAMALPILIILTGQATAAVAEVAMIAAVFLCRPGKRRSARVLFAIVGIIPFALLALEIYPLIAEHEDVLRRMGTYGARHELWGALFDLWPRMPVGTQLFGLPGGQYPELVVYLSGSYRVWEFSLHSMYFGTIPMIGYLGSFAYAFLIIILFAKSLRLLLLPIRTISTAPLALCLATAVLSYSYELRGSWLIGLFLCILLLRQSTHPLPRATFAKPMSDGRISAQERLERFTRSQR